VPYITFMPYTAVPPQTWWVPAFTITTWVPYPTRLLYAHTTPPHSTPIQPQTTSAFGAHSTPSSGRLLCRHSDFHHTCGLCLLAAWDGTRAVAILNAGRATGEGTRGAWPQALVLISGCSIITSLRARTLSHAAHSCLCGRLPCDGPLRADMDGRAPHYAARRRWCVARKSPISARAAHALNAFAQQVLPSLSCTPAVTRPPPPHLPPPPLLFLYGISYILHTPLPAWQNEHSYPKTCISPGKQTTASIAVYSPLHTRNPMGSWDSGTARAGGTAILTAATIPLPAPGVLGGHVANGGHCAGHRCALNNRRAVGW